MPNLFRNKRNSVGNDLEDPLEPETDSEIQPGAVDVAFREQ